MKIESNINMKSTGELKEQVAKELNVPDPQYSQAKAILQGEDEEKDKKVQNN